jgi:hypothetical protein
MAAFQALTVIRLSFDGLHAVACQAIAADTDGASNVLLGVMSMHSA